MSAAIPLTIRASPKLATPTVDTVRRLCTPGLARICSGNLTNAAASEIARSKPNVETAIAITLIVVPEKWTAKYLGIRRTAVAAKAETIIANVIRLGKSSPAETLSMVIAMP